MHGLMAGEHVPSMRLHARMCAVRVLSGRGVPGEGTGGEAGYGLDDCLKTAELAACGQLCLSLVSIWPIMRLLGTSVPNMLVCGSTGGVPEDPDTPKAARKSQNGCFWLVVGLLYVSDRSTPISPRLSIELAEARGQGPRAEASSILLVR